MARPATTTRRSSTATRPSAGCPRSWPGVLDGRRARLDGVRPVAATDHRHAVPDRLDHQDDDRPAGAAVPRRRAARPRRPDRAAPAGVGLRRRDASARCSPTWPGCRASRSARGGSARRAATVEELLAANDGSGAVFGPGEHYHYSNLGYGLLGEARRPAARRGRGAALVQERVLDPLGMTRTSYLPQPPYAAGPQRPPPRRHAHPGAAARHRRDGARRPAVEHARRTSRRFAAFLADGQPRRARPADAGRRCASRCRRRPDYGLGVRLVPWAGGMLVGHTGSMPGFQATVLRRPADPRRRGRPHQRHDRLLRPRARAGAARATHARADAGRGCRATAVPDVGATSCSATWYWGNSAYEVRWNNERLEWRDLARGPRSPSSSGCDGERIVGDGGLPPRRDPARRTPRGRVGATTWSARRFVYTREPYPDGP